MICQLVLRARCLSPAECDIPMSYIRSLSAACEAFTDTRTPPPRPHPGLEAIAEPLARIANSLSALQAAV